LPPSYCDPAPIHNVSLQTVLLTYLTEMHCKWKSSLTPSCCIFQWSKRR